MLEIENLKVLKNFKENVRKFLEESYREFEAKGYDNIVKESQKKKRREPFLSIIVRTQGKREESLREVFLCLEGQENQDFEVLLIGHKLNNNQHDLVQTIIDQQSDEMRNKIRYIALNTGNRTTPLNLGFANAWGKYIATLDDDDLVLDNWVSNFYDAAKSHEGRVLYNYTLEQSWSIIDKGDYKGALRAESSFGNEFANDYNDALQVELNRCPPVGLAYPAIAFQKMGIIFDEELATTEDWDYLTRVAYVCGVHNIQSPACIYRKWTNAETSFTVHKAEEWEQNYKTILKKTSKRMLCLSEGSSDTIVSLIRDREWLLNGNGKDTSRIFDCARIYIKTAGVFSENNTICAVSSNISQRGQFELTYIFEDIYAEAKQIRWDPIEEGILLIDSLNILIEFENGTRKSLNSSIIRHNGKEIDGFIFFVRHDPQILFNIQENVRVKKILIKGELRENVPIRFFEKLVARKSLADVIRKIKLGRTRK